VNSIAIVVPELLPVPPIQGGAVEYWVDEASKRMVKPTRRLAVVSRSAGVIGHEAIEYISIPWTSVETFFHRIKDRTTWKNPLRYVSKIQNVFSYGRRVARAVRDFDVIYLHNEPNILFFLNKRAGQKIVLHMHNDHLSMRLFRPFYRRALAKTDRVVCVSDYIRRQAIAAFPEYADQFCVIFNATDPEVFKPYGEVAVRQLNTIIQIESGKKYLLYVGRLTPIKGVHVLIKAFHEIHRLMPDVRLIITGSSFFGGAAKTAYEKELVILATSVRDAIIFTGYLPHEKLKFLYSAVDIIVLPSVWQDPCPLVVLEAMSSGTCLVSSAVGGIPEILENGNNGVLVEPGNVKTLACTTVDILNMPEIMCQIGIAARRKIIAGYTWSRLVDELEVMFASLK
jgi:spore coat protein SA